VNPPWGSILRAETVPEFGGDTSWSNQVAAYEALSEPLRQFIDGLHAQHRFLAGYTAAEEDDKLARHLNSSWRSW
jgi:taurine dioxygenase